MEWLTPAGIIVGLVLGYLGKRQKNLISARRVDAQVNSTNAEACKTEAEATSVMVGTD